MQTSDLTATAKIRIRRAPAEVFKAFADAEAMGKFWFTRRDDGLMAGQVIRWYIGGEPGAVSFDVRVKELSPSEKIVIEWENSGVHTQVTWLFEETEDGETILRIEESGFAGRDDEIIDRALDSTGGFNQVIVAAKALIEHGVAINVVADHA